jgi:putative transposase
VSAIAKSLAVSRSNVVEQAARMTARPRRYRKAGDADLLIAIRRLVDERPSYGYRRIAALLNRERKSAGLERLNGKRVLRVMQAHALTLQRHTARRPGRTHEGVVIALRSNIRWCSDHLELHCRNGDNVRVLFVIDACDREIIAWSAVAHVGVSGEMVRDLMIEAVEKRFGGLKTHHPVEWLSDNGSAYIAVDTADTATALGLRMLFTPVRSPESNGMSESLSKHSSATTRGTSSWSTPKRSWRCFRNGSTTIMRFTRTRVCDISRQESSFAKPLALNSTR